MAGGFASSASDVIDYITIAQTGNAVDFGNLSTVRYGVAGLSSPVRACFGGGANPNVNTIDYITIATTGNAQDY